MLRLLLYNELMVSNYSYSPYSQKHLSSSSKKYTERFSCEIHIDYYRQDDVNFALGMKTDLESYSGNKHQFSMFFFFYADFFSLLGKRRLETLLASYKVKRVPT